MVTNGSQLRKEESRVGSANGSSAEVRPFMVERSAHQDIPDIVQLYRRVWEPLKPELPAELTKAWQPSALEFSSWMEGVTYFVARRAGRLVGAIGCALAEGSGRLIHFAVDPEERRRGVGTALVQAAVDWARHNGAHSVWVEPLARFQAAAELFGRLGFGDSGTLHRHTFREDVRLFEIIL